MTRQLDRFDRRWFLSLLPPLFLTPVVFGSTANPDFSGTWKQSKERSATSGKGDVTLRIEQHDPDLIVETIAERNSGPLRHAVQRYTTDGKTSVSVGTDGDEFHTSIVWNGPSLVFSIEEHEDGRTIRSSETWSLIEDGAALKRVRERSDGSHKQTLIYLRMNGMGTNGMGTGAKGAS